MHAAQNKRRPYIKGCGGIGGLLGECLTIPPDGFIQVLPKEPHRIGQLSSCSGPLQRDSTGPCEGLNGQRELKREGLGLKLPLPVRLQGQLVITRSQVMVDLTTGKDSAESVEGTDGPRVIAG